MAVSSRAQMEEKTWLAKPDEGGIAAAASLLAIGAAQAADCKIGISMKTPDAPYFTAKEVSAKNAAEALGCEVISADA